MKQTLAAFGKSSMALAKLRREGEKLDTEAQAFIEKHFVILHRGAPVAARLPGVCHCPRERI
jgi:hypothetical protein